MSSWIFGRESDSASVASDRLFGGELDSGSEVVGSLEERTVAWIRGVVDSLEEGWTAAPFNKSDGSGHLETFQVC